MTFTAFQKRFNAEKKYDKVGNIILSLIMIVASIYFVIDSYGNARFENILIAMVIIFAISIYHLFEIQKHYKLEHFENTYSRLENVAAIIKMIERFAEPNTKQAIGKNAFFFLYRKSWWRMSYRVYIFADDNLIAINAEGKEFIQRGGVIDFGAARRIQKKIISLIHEKPSHNSG